MSEKELRPQTFEDWIRRSPDAMALSWLKEKIAELDRKHHSHLDDFLKLIERIEKLETWKDLHLKDLHGVLQDWLDNHNKEISELEQKIDNISEWCDKVPQWFNRIEELDKQLDGEKCRSVDDKDDPLDPNRSLIQNPAGDDSKPSSNYKNPFEEKGAKEEFEEAFSELGKITTKIMEKKEKPSEPETEEKIGGVETICPKCGYRVIHTFRWVSDLLNKERAAFLDLIKQFYKDYLKYISTLGLEIEIRKSWELSIGRFCDRLMKFLKEKWEKRLKNES